MPNQDERRAKLLLVVSGEYIHYTLDMEQFEKQWLQFLQQGSHFGNPEALAYDFVKFVELGGE